MIYASDLRVKSKEELSEQLKKLKIELSQKKQNLMLGKDKKLGHIAVLRRDIARISTVLREKEILEDL